MRGHTPRATRALTLRAAAGAAGLAFVACLVLTPAVGSAWVLNHVQLDDATCGHNLQLGSDVTASSSATPWFLLDGDGSKASYQVRIDDVAIGTFSSNMFANVCIHDASPLAEGSHTLTASEIAPNPANPAAHFDFTVDTVPPPPPSRPVLASYSDSGVVGDNSTMFANPTLTGTSGPRASVLLLDNGVPGIGGALADSSGNWTARTTPLAGGTHAITAVVLDEAGNQSAPSGALSLTVDTTPPSVPQNVEVVSTTAGSVALAWTASTDNRAVRSYDIYRNGVKVGTQLASGDTVYVDSALAARATYMYYVKAQDAAGNTSVASQTVAATTGTASAPQPPTIADATPGAASAKVSFMPGPAGGSPIIDFTTRCTSADGGTSRQATSAASPGVVAGLTNGKTYTCAVAARNALGTSAPSAPSRALVPASAPSQGRLVRAVPGNGSATVHWAVPLSDGGSPITGYAVIPYLGVTSLKWHVFTSTATTQVITGLSNGKTYAFKVAAKNAVGRGLASARSAGIRVGAPTAPTKVSATAGRGRATVRWGAPTSNNGSPLTGFLVTPHHGSTSYAAVHFGAAARSGVVSGLVAGRSYTFTVVATNGRGPGPPSAPSKPTVPS